MIREGDMRMLSRARGEGVVGMEDATCVIGNRDTWYHDVGGRGVGLE